MAFFPTDTGGFFDGMNIFGAKMPTYLGGADGLLSTTEQEKLKNQALISGILGAGATYLAQPKNQGYGSALPYLAKSYLGGMTQSQGAYDQGTQNLLTQGKLAEFKREAETAKLTKEAQATLMEDERVKNNPVLKALVAKGEFPKVADIISPKPAENDYDRYSFAYKDKAFKDLTGTEKQEIIKQVQADKQASANQINLGSPVPGVDPTTGQPVFFQASRTGGKPEIVPGIVPKAGEAQTKQIGGIDSLQEAISSYKDKLKTWSPTDAADPNKRAQMKTVYNNMMLQAKEAYGLGVLNGPDYTILTDTIADPTTPKGVAYGAFGALEGQADTLSELMQRTKQSLQGAKGIKPKENAPSGNQPKVIKFNSQGQRIN